MNLPMFGKDWRMRWLQTRRRETLHRVYVIDWADDDHIWGHGVTACGMLDELHMPGILSRMGSPRCKTCCLAAGVPPGVGAPSNQGIDA